MPNFSDRLKQLRQERGLTQEQLAEQTDIPAASIRRLEVSETSLPRKDRLVMLSDYFNVSIDYLVGNSNNRSEKENYKKSLDEETNEYVLRELVEKYQIDLTDPRNRETLEKMIRLVYEDL
ncbi:helix-turn-helix domain-containing protein [Paenibacillus sp. OVF10]|nr:helix-turn-helix domain-containing protein [Paenibacillus sp. OVF10]